VLAGIWADPGCAGGQIAVAVSGSNLSVSSGFGIILYEVGGLLTSAVVDQVASATGTETGTWSSGSTLTTTTPYEAWFGADTGLNILTQPGTPWTSSEYNSGAIGGGYQLVSAEGSAVYAGTCSNATNAYAAAVATLKGTAPSGGLPSGEGIISVGPQGLGNVWYPAQAVIGTTSGINDNSVCNAYLGVAGVPTTLVGTAYPGGSGTIALAVPPLSPGEYLIFEWTGGNPGDVASVNVLGTMDTIIPVLCVYCAYGEDDLRSAGG
jgi:hypothetical protein